jgi:hypothetical protein
MVLFLVCLLTIKVSIVGEPILFLGSVTDNWQDGTVELVLAAI